MTAQKRRYRFKIQWTIDSLFPRCPVFCFFFFNWFYITVVYHGGTNKQKKKYTSAENIFFYASAVNVHTVAVPILRCLENNLVCVLVICRLSMGGWGGGEGGGRRWR